MADVMSDLTKLDLICLRISNGASAVKGLPKRLKVLNWGVNETKKGAVVVGPQTVRQLALNQDSHGFDRVALDYEHNTVPGTPEFERTKEPREVAAYGVPLVVPGEGLFLDDLIYTPSGEKNALSYIDLSPAVTNDPVSGEIVFMHSTALCRQGATPDVSYYSVTLNPKEKEPTMDMKEVLAQLDALSKSLADLKAVVEGMKPKEVVETLSVSRELSGKVTAHGETVKALTDRLDKFERQSLVDKATHAGKVIPLNADELAKVDLVTLSAMIDKLPPTVPLHQRTPATTVSDPADAAAVIAQYNAIKDPTERANFFRKHRNLIGG